MRALIHPYAVWYKTKGEKGSQKTIQKERKETTKEGGLSSTIMDQKSIYNSTHKPQRSLNETLGFNHGHHQY